MKIECPVCHEEIPASQLNEIREFDCPHCHYRIEMEPFAASLTQLFPVAALILFIPVFTILKLFLPEQTLVIVFLVVFCAGARLHTRIRWWQCVMCCATPPFSAESGRLSNRASWGGW